MFTRPRILWLIGSLVILAAIVLPSYAWYTVRAGQATALDKAKQDIQSQFLQSAFVGKYGGDGVSLVGVNKSEDYVFYWKDTAKQMQYASVYIGGKWVELGSAPIPADNKKP